MYKNLNNKKPKKYDKRGEIGIVKTGKRLLKIPLATKQKTKNAMLKSINTKESIKLIKSEKHIDIEKIFNKK